MNIYVIISGRKIQYNQFESEVYIKKSTEKAQTYKIMKYEYSKN